MRLTHAIRRPADPNESTSSFDLSISDLMTGLLMLFILLLMGVLLTLQQQRETYFEINKKAKNYLDLRNELYEELKIEFSDEMKEWNAVLDSETLSFRFINAQDETLGNVYFRPNSQVLEPIFENVLNDFFPRFVNIIYKPKYRKFITEIRIEGHAVNWLDKYEYNYLMNYSQVRANNVLRFVHGNRILTTDQRVWLEEKFAANGFGSSRPIYRDDGILDDVKSRRVEFRIITDAERKIQEIYNFEQEN